MEGVEQEAGAARPGAHDAPDAVAAHDTIDTAEAHAAKAAATAAPKRPKSAEEIMRLVEDKAAAEEGAPQGGSAGGGSQKAAEAEGEEGAKAVVTFIHKSSQVPVAFFGWYMHVRVYLVLFPLYTIY
jgi:hypothetical protein